MMKSFCWKSGVNKDLFEVHIRDDVAALVRSCEKTDTRITLDLYLEIKLNSYEQKFIEPWLSDQALIHKIENAVKNRSARLGKYDLAKHYDEYLLTDGVDELLKRLKGKTWDFGTRK
jgi:hypothetical protein